MKKELYFSKLKELLEHSNISNGFIIDDLSKNGLGYETNKKSLQRLEKKGLIKRSIRGIYFIPKFSKILNEYIEPNYKDVVAALSRKYKWTILPSQQSVLNMLGLSKQLEDKVEYLTSGPNKVYEIYGTKVYLKHSNDTFMFKCSKPTMIFIQAIKGLGISKVSDSDIYYINKYFNRFDKQTILKEIEFYKDSFIKITKKIKL